MIPVKVIRDGRQQLLQVQVGELPAPATEPTARSTG